MADYNYYHNFDVVLDCPGCTDQKIEKVTLTHNGDTWTADYTGADPSIVPLIVNPTSFETDETQQKAGRYLAQTFLPAGDVENGLSDNEKQGRRIGNRFREFLQRYSRVRLRLYYPDDETKATRLLQIPWEYLYIDDPAIKLKLNGFLCTRAGFSLTHHLPWGDRSAKPNVDQLPVRLAFLYTGSTDSDLDDATGSYDAIKQDFDERSSKAIVRLDGKFFKADESDIAASLLGKGSSIVQIYSHSGEEALEVPGGVYTSPELLSLRNFLQGQDNRQRLKAVIICGCKAARHPRGVTAILHNEGVPIVIGLTGSVEPGAARLFMKSFYTAIAEGVYTLEEALAFGRLLLWQSKSDDPTKRNFQWGLPRLYLGGAHSDVVLKDVLFQPVNNLVQRFQATIESRLDRMRQPTVVDHRVLTQRLDTAINLTPEDIELQEEIKMWLQGNTEILYLSGPSGGGKSAVIAWLLQNDLGNERFIYHICTDFSGADDDITNDPLAFSQDSLFTQLEAYYQKIGFRFRSQLGKGVYPITARDPEEAFFDLVVNPLRQAYAKTSKRPIIVIDGVDNAVESSPNCSILDLLLVYRYELTQAARLFVTADSDAEAIHKRILNDLKPDQKIYIKTDSEARVWLELETDDKFKEILRSTSPDLHSRIHKPIERQLLQKYPRSFFNQDVFIGSDQTEELTADAKSKLLPVVKFAGSAVQTLLIGASEATESADWLQQPVTKGGVQHFQEYLFNQGPFSDAAGQDKLTAAEKLALLQLSKQVEMETALFEDLGTPVPLRRSIPHHQARQFVDRIVKDAAKHYPEGAVARLFDALERVAMADTQQKAKNPAANLRQYYKAYLAFVLDKANGQATNPIRQLLAALAVAYDPLPLAMVARLVQVDGEQQVLDMVDKVSGFVKRLANNQGLVCEHPSIKRFLAESKDELGGADTMHALFVRIFRPEGADTTWKDVAEWPQLPDANYAQHYLVDHAYDVYRNSSNDVWEKRAEDFLDLITAPRFRCFRLGQMARSCEKSGVPVEDIRRALRVVLAKEAIKGGAPWPQVLTWIENLLTAYTSDENVDILDLEKKIRDGGGIQPLLDFLDLSDLYE